MIRSLHPEPLCTLFPQLCAVAFDVNNDKLPQNLVSYLPVARDTLRDVLVRFDEIK